MPMFILASKFSIASCEPPVKCQLTITRKSNNSSRSSKLTNFEYLVSNQVVQVNSFEFRDESLEFRVNLFEFKVELFGFQDKKTKKQRTYSTAQR